MNYNISADVFQEPFPHIIFHNFYDESELKLIWEELDFYTKDGKLFEAKDFGGVVEKTNSKAIWLDKVYPKQYRHISNILTVNRKIFDEKVLEAFGNIHDCCFIAKSCNYDTTKVRYYHDGNYYKPHIDKTVQFLGDAPEDSKYMFKDAPATLYFDPGKNGWDKPFGGKPLKPMNEFPN